VRLSPKAKGRVRVLEVETVRNAPGVIAVIMAADIPGRNDIAPHAADEPLLAAGEVMFHGQPLFAVVAETRDLARRAARLATLDIEEDRPALTIGRRDCSGRTRAAGLQLGCGDCGGPWPRRPIASKGRSPSAARSISISKARRRSRCLARLPR